MSSENKPGEIRGRLGCVENLWAGRGVPARALYYSRGGGYPFSPCTLAKDTWTEPHFIFSSATPDLLPVVDLERWWPDQIPMRRLLFLVKIIQTEGSCINPSWLFNGHYSLEESVVSFCSCTYGFALFPESIQKKVSMAWYLFSILRIFNFF